MAKKKLTVKALEAARKAIVKDEKKEKEQAAEKVTASDVAKRFNVQLPTTNKTTSTGSKTAPGANARKQAANAAYMQMVANLANRSKQYAAQGTDYVLDLANSIISGAATKPDKGNIGALDIDAVHDMTKGTSQVARMLTESGVFNIREIATNPLYAHLAQQDYRASLLPTLREELANSQKADEANKAAQAEYEAKLRNLNADYSKKAETAAQWKDFFSLLGENPTLDDKLRAAGIATGQTYDMSVFRGMDKYTAYEKKQALDNWFAGLDAAALSAAPVVEEPEAPKYTSKTAGIQDEISTLEKYINAHKTLEELTAYARSNPNFAADSVYAAPDYSDVSAWEQFLMPQMGGAYADNALYTYINTGDVDPYFSQAQGSADYYKNWEELGYDYMLDQDKEIWNVLRKMDPAKADAYLQALSQIYLLPTRAQGYRAWDETVATNPWTAAPAWAGSVLQGVGNILDVPQQFAEAWAGVDNPYSAAFDNLNRQGNTRGAQLGGIRESDMPDWLKTVTETVYQGVSSIADNTARLLASGMNPTASLIMAGMQSASGSLRESAERDDVSSAAKIIKAIGTGAIEVGTEKIGLDALFDMGKTGAKKYLSFLLSELGEESANTASEPVLEAVVAFLFDHEADIKSGPEFWKDLKDTFLTTLVSASFMGGGAVASDYLNTRSYGKAITKDGDADTIVHIAQGMAEDSESKRIADEIAGKQGKGKKPSFYKFGQLTKALAKDLGEEHTAVINRVQDEAIADRLQELGDDAETAKKNAPIIRKVYRGEKLTMDERAAVRWNDRADKVAKELIRENNYTGDQPVPIKWVKGMKETQASETADVIGKQLQVQVATMTPIGKAAARAEEAAKKRVPKRDGKPKQATDSHVTFHAPDGNTEISGDILRFEESDEGMNVVVQTGKGKEGEQKVKLEDWISADGDGVATILSYVGDEQLPHSVTAEEANTMMQVYKASRGNAKAVIQAFDVNYLAGYSGADKIGSALDPGLAKVAYEAGKAEAEKVEATRIERAKAARKVTNPTVGWIGEIEGNAPITGKGDSTALDAEIENMTDGQRLMVEYGKALAKRAGINVVFYRSKVGADGKITTDNGRYVAATHTIYLDINAGVSDATTLDKSKVKGTLGYAMSRTLGHEVTHAIEATSVEYYAKYKQAVKKALSARGKDWAVLVRDRIDAAIAAGQKMTYAEAESEVVADASEYMLQDAKITQELEPGLYNKIKSVVKNFVTKLNDVFRELGLTGSTESKLLREMRDGVYHYMDGLQELWGAAFDEMAGLEGSVVKNGVEDALYETGEVYSYTAQSSARVHDKETIEHLENQQHITTYRAMQLIDGELYPPMAEFIGSKKDGNREDASAIGHWEMATEHPELIKWVDGKPKFELKKVNDDGSVSTVPAAYNPYMHSSNTVLNDQFSKAFQRKNLVVVECVVPVSESDGAYHAQYAKDATGWHEWKSGIVAGELAKQKSGFRRDVFLSRYIKPVRILPDSEVAEKIAGYLDGTDVTVPFQSAWPTLRDALVQAGVNVTEPRGLGPAQMKIAMEAFEEWKNNEADIRHSRRVGLDRYVRLDGMTEQRYNKYGWAIANDVLSERETARFLERIGGIKNGDQYPRSDEGHYIIGVGDGEPEIQNRFIVTDGNYASPSIERIYSVPFRREPQIEFYRRMFISAEEESHYLARRYVLEADEEELVAVYGRQDFESLQEVSGKRSHSRRGIFGGSNYRYAGQSGLRGADESDVGQGRDVTSPDGIDINEDDESAYFQSSARTWYESDYVTKRDEAAAHLANTIGVPVSKASKWIDDVTSVAAYVMGNKARVDYIPTAVKGVSAFKSNPEYGGSIDMSTICAKRRLATGTLDAIQRVLGDEVLTKDDFLRIREIMKERGHEVACGLCFVESSRKNLSKYNAQFMDQYNANHPDSEVTMTDLNTVDGLENLQLNNEDAYAEYEKFMNKLAQRKPKLFEKRTEYEHEILKRFKSDTTVGTKNRNGGLRLQSFSDFEIVHLIDMMQVITDMASVGLAGQAYTKVSDFAWALGNTGLKINLSLIAKGVDADGNLIFDDVEGMPYKEAKKLRDYYSENVGTVVVTFTDEQLVAAMKNDFVDYIIPFHRSQWQKSDYKKLGLPEGTKDYTLHQNEKEGRKRVKENFLPNAYWDHSLSGDENAKVYLQMCEDAGRTPKFAKFLSKDEDGHWVAPSGYWKLLIDFKMYDNNGSGSPQLPVQPNFNMNQAMRMLEEYKGEHDSFPVAQDVVDDFVQEYRDSKGGVQKSGGQYTINPYQSSTRIGLPEEMGTREYISESDDSIAETVEERNALTIYQRRLKEHAEASEAVMAAEKALVGKEGQALTDARAKLAKARAHQNELYRRLLKVENTEHVQKVMARTQQFINEELQGKTRQAVDKAIADREAKISELKADLAGLKGAAKTQREADIRQHERIVARFKSKAAQMVLDNSEKYQRQISNIRERRDLNLEIGKKASHIKRVVKRLNNLIIHETDYKNVKEPLKPAVLTLVQTFTENFGDLVFNQKTADKLHSVYAALAQNEETSEYYDPEVADWMTTLSDLARKDAERRMGGSTLESLNDKLYIYNSLADIADHVAHLVTEANQLFIEGKKAEVSAVTEEVGSTLVAKKDRRELAGKAGKVANFAENLIVKGNMIPQFFFEGLKNDGMMRLYDSLQSGANQYAERARMGEEFLADAMKRHSYHSWSDMKKPMAFKTKQGHTVYMTRENMMWAYAAAKREASNTLTETHHLDEGGFAYSDDNRPKAGVFKAEGANTHHKLVKEDIETITQMLTADQIAFMDECVEFLSTTCAEWGNEASMKLFGIAKYKEGYYFPFKVDQGQLRKDSAAGSTSATSDARVKHSSFTHALRKGANTPLVMGNFTDVIADHINQMATYSALVVPIENMNRVMNRKVDDGGDMVTIRSLIGRKHGAPSSKYIDDLLKDLNGGPQTDNRGTIDAGIRLFKRNAVVGKMSVAIQQPTAITRAFAYINPKYFAGINLERPKHTWERMMQYSGTAVMKDMGGFNVGLGKQAADWMVRGDLGDYNIFKRSKFLFDQKGFVALKNEWVDFLTGLPGWMDRLTWCAIWNAAERETAAKNPGMNQNSEEFLQLVGQRFDDIINHTQVYDSILSKSQNMRSKNALAKMATSFMAESTLNMNLAYAAIASKNPKRIGRVVSSLLLNAALGAAAYALVGAWNKDDDDRTWEEKYAVAFASRLADNLNPMASIPYLADIWNKIQGYDVERTDLSYLLDLAEDGAKFFGKMFDPDEALSYRDYENFVGGMFAAATGIPAKNWMGDGRRIWNMVHTKNENAPSSRVWYGILDEILPWRGANNTAYYERLLAAIKDGDKQEQYDLKDYLMSTKGVKESTINTGVREAYEKEYKRGNITKDEAVNFLTANNLVTGDTADKKKKSAFEYVDKWEEGTESYSAYNTLRAAFSGGNNVEIQKAWKELESNGWDKDTIGNYVRGTIIKEMVTSGAITPSKATELIRKWYPYKKDSDNVDKPKEWLKKK